MIRTLTLLTAVASTLAQFISPPRDLIKKTGYAGVDVRYKQVPAGICELDPRVKSFSGYADVAEHQHLFFWFFEARDVDPHNAPLTVWINGGPGSSSMIGLFQELGPCSVDSSGRPVNNPYSWSTVSNMLFIDQPTQTGFSYSIPVPAVYDPNSGNLTVLQHNKCPKEYAGQCGTFPSPNPKLTADSTADAAPNFWKALQGFMGVFPQYSRDGFHFATESYGGHYGPIFNDYIERQNSNLPKGAKKINLESVMIGNGWYDPLIQYQAYYNFTVYPGNTYDIRPYNKTTELQIYNDLYGPDGCVEQTKECYRTGNGTICGNSDAFCQDNIEGPFDARDEYDSRELYPDPFPYTYYQEYLNTGTVLKAIGAFVNYTDSDNEVYYAFATTGDDDREDMTIQACLVANEVNAPGYVDAGFANISTSDHIVHGVVKQADNFAFSRIYYAGHEVPFYQPLAALTLFNRTIHGLDIETGTKRVKRKGGYRTCGPRESLFREGNATVQYAVLPANATYNTTTHAPNPPY